MPTQGAKKPVVTADPTDESVKEGGSCLYIATANNADLLTWHFVSADGKVDVSYDKIGQYFPTLGVSGGNGTNLTLSNIPLDFNGWRSYCVFTNTSGGSANSGQAVTYVSAASTPTPTPGAVTPVPTDDDPFNGTYVEEHAGRGVITITGNGIGEMHYVTVTWSSSAYQSSEWTFSGYFDGRACMQYSNCLKTTTTFDENGNGTPVEEYSYGTGYIKLDDFGLTWSDDQEHIADDAYFVKQ